MANGPRGGQPAEPPAQGAPAPSQLASVPPPDLYATSDIRFVMLEIGKLTSKVDRLIDDVKSQGTKLDKLRLTVAWVGGGAAVLAFLITLAVKVLPLPHF